MHKLLKRSIPALLAIGLLGSTASATIFFYEDFNAYTSDADMTAAGWVSVSFDQLAPGDPMYRATVPSEGAIWTLKSGGSGPSGGRANPNDRNGRNTVGQYVISDSDAAGGNDGGDYNIGYVLETPTIDCSAASEVFLHFACFAELNDNGWAIFELWISTDNGATWTGFEQRIPPGRGGAPLADANTADGIAGTVDYYLTPLGAAGSSQVKIRFVQRGCDDDWWICIDDIVVDDYAPPVGDQVLLATEDFAAGIPGTWSVSTHCGDNPWQPYQLGVTRAHISESGVAGNRIINRLDTTHVIIDSDKDPDNCSDREYLDTPVIDCSAVGMVVLDFDSELTLYDDAYEGVAVSVDGGTTFLLSAPDPDSYGHPQYDPVWTYDYAGDYSEDPRYCHHYVPVPEAAGQSSVVLRFYYMSDNGNEWYWAIDKVRVTGYSGALWTPPAVPGLAGQTSFSLNEAVAGISLNTSAFDAGGQPMSHLRTEYQVRLYSKTWAEPFASGGVSSGDLTSFTIYGLARPGTYVCRVKHVGLRSGVTLSSDWSGDINFFVGGPEGTILVLSETFNELQPYLLPAFHEDPQGAPLDPSILGWTHQPPLGWTIDYSNMDGDVASNVDGSYLGGGNGVFEWYGWSFTTSVFWQACAGQGRDQFEGLADIVFAVADSDEYDDRGDAQFDSTLISPAITVPAGKKAYVVFVSDYRYESPGIGEFRISKDNLATSTVLKTYWGTDMRNQMDMFELPAELSSYNMQLMWEYFGDTPEHWSTNNWWLAVDNVNVYVESEVLSARRWMLYD